MAMPPLEYKSLFGAETKVLTDDGEGIVEAIVSVTGIKDQVDDVIVPGAYAKTLAQRWPKGVYSHDWDHPVSKALDVKELVPGDPNLPKSTSRGEPWPQEAGALVVKMMYNLDTQRGRDAYSDVKFFESEQEWSIGYNVPRAGARVDHKKGIRFINTLDLYEFSQVLFGAMPMAGTVGVKALQQAGGMIIGSPSHKMIQDIGGEKTLDGSYEQRRDLLDHALTEVLIPNYGTDDNHEWLSLRATFDDHVIACVWRQNQEPQDYQVSYTITGDQVTLGDPQPVKIEETVVPVAADDTDAGDEPGGDAVTESDLDVKRAVSAEKRSESADAGHALPDGSYPIENVSDLKNAIQAYGRAKDKDKAKAHIVSRARALKAVDELPDDWGVEKALDDDVETKDLTVSDGEAYLSPSEIEASKALRAAIAAEAV